MTTEDRIISISLQKKTANMVSGQENKTYRSKVVGQENVPLKIY